MKQKRDVNRDEATLVALTIREFCVRYSISRALYYKMANLGTGPKTFKAGTKPLISVEAAEAWRRDMESKSEMEAAKSASG